MWMKPWFHQKFNNCFWSNNNRYDVLFWEVPMRGKSEFLCLILSLWFWKCLFMSSLENGPLGQAHQLGPPGPLLAGRQVLQAPCDREETLRPAAHPAAATHPVNPGWRHRGGPHPVKGPPEETGRRHHDKGHCDLWPQKMPLPEASHKILPRWSVDKPIFSQR